MLKTMQSDSGWPQSQGFQLRRDSYKGERDAEWMRLARERSVPLESARRLFERAWQESGHLGEQVVLRTYWSLLVGSTTTRVTPGKISRTMHVSNGAAGAGNSFPQDDGMADIATPAALPTQAEPVLRAALPQSPEQGPSGRLHDAMRAARGFPLPADLRQSLERLLHADFSQVRIHTDSAAADAAASIQARAFTAGSHIFFARGHFQPQQPAGWQLLLHELVHVRQWKDGRVARTGSRVSAPDEPLEREADAVARRVVERIDRFGADDASLAVGPGTEEAIALAAALLGEDMRASGIPGHSAGRRAAEPERDVRIMRDEDESGATPRDESGGSGVPEGGEPVNQIGVVSWDDEPELRLRSAPDTSSTDNIIASLPFGMRVHVIKRFPGDWFYVSTPAGQMGYVASMYIWTDLPEPNARLHRVQAGLPGTAIAIAEQYYGGQADDWGQDLRFYVNVLAWANNVDVPNTTEGWRDVHFQAGNFIWIPSQEFARSLQGTVNSGSYTYNFADSIGLAGMLERAGQLWDDLVQSIELSKQYIGEAIVAHSIEAIRTALESLAVLLIGAALLLAITTTIGALIGSAPGAAAGFEVGLVLLEWLGLGLLIAWVGQTLLRVGGAFGRYFAMVWEANGDPTLVDMAARLLADAVGTLIGAIIEALIIIVGMHGVSWVMGRMGGTRFTDSIGEARLREWLGQRRTNVQEGNAPLWRPGQVWNWLRGRGNEGGEGAGAEQGRGGESTETGGSEQGRGGEGTEAGGTEAGTGAAEAGSNAGGRYDPTVRSETELRTDLDPTQRTGETSAEALERVNRATEELQVREALSTYEALGENPRRVELRAEEPAHADAHTLERHGADVPLRRADNPGGRTIEGRIYGDSPWARPENASARWFSDSMMNRTVNEYLRTNWETIRSDLALEGRHTNVFDTGGAVGEGFYNGGAYGTGARNAVYSQTSMVRITILLDPGPPAGFHIITTFPSIMGQ